MSYIPIRVSTLRGDQNIGFDTYIRVAGKMILYLHQGDSFEGPRLQKLKEKKLRKLFILNEQGPKYLDYLKVNIEAAYDLTSSKDMATRAEIIQGSQQSLVEEVFEDTKSSRPYLKLKEEAEKYVQFIMGSSDAVQALLSVSNTDLSLAHHGVNVSTLSVALAQKLKIADEKRLQLLALGALLHDFGHQNKSLDHTKPIKSLSPEEFEIWKNHPFEGGESIKDETHFDPEISTIMRQHEEKCNGTGPLGLIEKNQDPLAILVSSSNTVDRLFSFEKILQTEIPKKLMLDYLGCHPLQHIQHLIEIVKTF